MKKITIALFSLLILFAGLVNSTTGPIGMTGMLEQEDMGQTTCVDTQCVSSQAGATSSTMQCLQHCLSSKQTPGIGIYSLNIIVLFGGLLLFFILRNLLQASGVSTRYFRQTISKILLRKNLATVILLD